MMFHFSSGWKKYQQLGEKMRNFAVKSCENALKIAKITTCKNIVDKYRRISQKMLRCYERRL